jgi:hypothetical protein
MKFLDVQKEALIFLLSEISIFKGVIIAATGRFKVTQRLTEKSHETGTSQSPGHVRGRNKVLTR